jgi:hypothetical protein
MVTAPSAAMRIYAVITVADDSCAPA